MTHPKKLTPEDMDMLTREFQDLKSMIDKYTVRLNSLKKELSDQVDVYGEEDDRGNKWIALGNYQLKRERRAGVSFSSDDAEEWAKENGYWDDVVEVIEVVSEDKVLSLAWKDDSLKTQIDALFKVRESWAFKIVDKKAYTDD